MIHILFDGFGWTDIALTLNRVAVGMFFMFSGYHKLFNAERHRAFADELRSLHVHAVGINQWWVPLVEFSAGGAVVIGLSRRSLRLGFLSSSSSPARRQGESESKHTSRSIEQTGSMIGSICRKPYMRLC
jgi:hypothetical protein